MAEPADPAVLGVASALKSLRTRAGLREERLHGTELALDTLTGLDSIRALINAGEPAERAIVRAVRAAAGTLEPTMSIVADASLGLELSADQMPDAELYAGDLGQRREAVLRNWDQLHELRSVPPGKAPSPRALRLEVEAEALMALAVALTRVTGSGELPAVPGEALPGGPQSGVSAVGPAELQVFGAELTKTFRMRGSTVEQAAAELAVPAAEVARWTTGEALPSEPQARALDEHLTARGAIQNLVIELRSMPDRPEPRLVPGLRPTCRLPPCSRRSAMSRRHSGVASSGTPTASPWDGRAICASCRVTTPRRRPPRSASGRCCCWRTAWRLI